MNALPIMLANPPSATEQESPILNVAVVNALIDALSDTELYESEESKPSADVVTRAANALATVPIQTAEIAPYFGEINVTWRTQSARVKAIFGPQAEVFSVYREFMTGDRVTFHFLQPNATVGYLHSSIEWLKNPVAHV
jgi:hypothetical protein